MWGHRKRPQRAGLFRPDVWTTCECRQLSRRGGDEDVQEEENDNDDRETTSFACQAGHSGDGRVNKLDGLSWGADSPDWIEVAGLLDERTGVLETHGQTDRHTDNTNDDDDDKLI